MLPELASVRITAYEEGGKFIGHRVLPVIGLCPGYRHVNLRNELGQPLLLATLFLCIVVKDYVPDGLSDFAEALANPIKYQSELEKRAEQLAVLTEDMEPIPEDDVLCESEHDATVAKQSKVDTLPLSQTDTSDGLLERGAETAGSAHLAVTASQGNSINASASHSASGAGASGAELGSSAMTMGSLAPIATTPLVAGPMTSQQNTTDTSTATAASTKSLEAIEADALEAEPLESILANKCVREKRQEMEKKLESLRKKHDKEKLRVCSGPKSGESSLDKRSKFNMGNKLVKRLSNKSM